MKVLFLDIDGVLVSKRSIVAGNGNWPIDFLSIDEFDNVAIKLIQKLCNKTDCKVVVSSTWRYDFDSEAIEKALEIPVIGSTPTGNFHIKNPYHVRGNEIDMYLNEHPEITKYAIVDDIAQFLPHQQRYFVQTSEKWGLSLRNYLDLKAILN